MPKRQHTDGFTLIELMVVLLLVAIIVGAGLPTLKATVVNNGIRTEASNIAHSLTYARTQAASLGRPITMTTKAGAGSTNWSQGWQITADILLKDTDISNNNLTVTSNDGAHSTITFLASGRLSGANNGAQIAICDRERDNGITGRLITLNTVGRVNISTIDNNAANCDFN